MARWWPRARLRAAARAPAAAAARCDSPALRQPASRRGADRSLLRKQPQGTHLAHNCKRRRVLPSRSCEPCVRLRCCAAAAGLFSTRRRCGLRRAAGTRTRRTGAAPPRPPPPRLQQVRRWVAGRAARGAEGGNSRARARATAARRLRRAKGLAAPTTRSVLPSPRWRPPTHPLAAACSRAVADPLCRRVLRVYGFVCQRGARQMSARGRARRPHARRSSPTPFSFSPEFPLQRRPVPPIRFAPSQLWSAHAADDDPSLAREPRHR